MQNADVYSSITIPYRMVKLLDCQGLRDQQPLRLCSIQTVAKDWKMVRVLKQRSLEI